MSPNPPRLTEGVTDPSQLSRTQADVGTDGPSDVDSIRVYYDPQADSPPMPSVSVIKGLREDPEKENALEGWRQRYDGQSQYARPWWKDQRNYKRYRGTLIHFAILDELGTAGGDDYFHTVGDREYGYEEYTAEYALRKWSKHAPSANDDSIPYCPRDNRYDGEHAWDRAVREMRWATRAFKEDIIDNEERDFTPSNVRTVESYVHEPDWGYAGQYDLLYDTEDGETVLADLKTSSAVRFDHKLQSAGYKYAIESITDCSIDRCQIIRLHPDSETVEVSDSDEWDRTLRGLAAEFLGLADQAQSTYAKPLQRAQEALTERHEGRQSELKEQRDSDSLSESSVSQ